LLRASSHFHEENNLHASSLEALRTCFFVFWTGGEGRILIFFTAVPLPPVPTLAFALYPMEKLRLNTVGEAVFKKRIHFGFLFIS